MEKLHTKKTEKKKVSEVHRPAQTINSRRAYKSNTSSYLMMDPEEEWEVDNGGGVRQDLEEDSRQSTTRFLFFSSSD